MFTTRQQTNGTRRSNSKRAHLQSPSMHRRQHRRRDPLNMTSRSSTTTSTSRGRHTHGPRFYIKFKLIIGRRSDTNRLVHTPLLYLGGVRRRHGKEKNWNGCEDVKWGKWGPDQVSGKIDAPVTSQHRPTMSAVNVGRCVPGATLQANTTARHGDPSHVGRQCRLSGHTANIRRVVLALVG